MAAAAAAAVRVARGMSDVGDTSGVDAPDPEDVANLTALLRSAEAPSGAAGEHATLAQLASIVQRRGCDSVAGRLYGVMRNEVFPFLEGGDLTSQRYNATNRLERMRFAVDILGERFFGGAPVDLEHFQTVFEDDAVELLAYLLDDPNIPRSGWTRSGLDRFPRRLATKAMSFGALNCLKYLHEKHHVCPELYTEHLVQCAKNGHVDCLRYVIDNGGEGQTYTCVSSIRKMARSLLHDAGHYWTYQDDVEYLAKVPVLAYLETLIRGPHHRINDFETMARAFPEMCPAWVKVFELLGVDRQDFRVAHEHWVKVFEHDSVHVLECLFTHTLRNTLFLAVYVAPWRSSEKIEWQAYFSRLAFQSGALNCLKYLQEHHRLCEWINDHDDQEHVILCAERGHVDCLRYALENGGTIDIETLFSEHLLHVYERHWSPYGVCKSNAGPVIEWLINSDSVGDRWELVFRCDSPRVLEYCEKASEVARVDAHDPHISTKKAMSFGALRCLEYLQGEHGVCPHITARTLFLCAKNGHVECLRYAIEHGAVCDARELLQNPDVQNMEVIQYLRTLALVANDGASDTEETEDALRNTLARVTTAAERGHLREETYRQAANDLMMADRERRQPRDDD